MKLERYLRRIDAPMPDRPTVELLGDLLRAHVTSVPFENLDVQFGRRLSTDVDAAYEKIVEQNRGGWCYEQNGLFGWALSEVGFDVTRVAAGVMRHERGEAADANHLCLLVRLPEDESEVWLADVGLGGSLFGPLPLADSTDTHPPFEVRLERQPDDRWRFTEDSSFGPFSFDFFATAADETALSAKCLELQTDPESSFVLNLIAQLRHSDEHLSLRGRVLTRTRTEGAMRQTLDSADELVDTLRAVFGLDVPDVAALWPRILARHDELFGDGEPGE
ncbi:MAG: arylamine N-acetyltransferase [Woeseiaceae bacterium]|nr:arylamine N-acetyltransferase [Woeseiaceae bacterium]